MKVSLISLLLFMSGCKQGHTPEVDAGTKNMKSKVESSADLSFRAARCVEPKPLVLFMPGCGFASCGGAQGGPWLAELKETLNGLVPQENIRLVGYDAGLYPNTGAFAASVRAAMQNTCYSKVITAGASAGDTVGSHLATHYKDFNLPRPVDAHIGLYGPKQFRYYRDHPEIQGVPNNAGRAMPAMQNLALYAGGSSNHLLDRASPQTYAAANNPTPVLTSMGTLDRRINADTGKLFFDALGGSRNGFNVLHTCIGGAHGYHFNGGQGKNPTDIGGAAFGGDSCPDFRGVVRSFVCRVIAMDPCPES